jgi:hypothetical protein
VRTLGIILFLFCTAVKAQNRPFINQTEIGILAGDVEDPSFSAQTFYGVRLAKSNFEAGLTAGIDDYEQLSMLPVGMRFNWNPFITHLISPYLSLNAGYGCDWLQPATETQWYKGGFMINPSMGLRIKTTTVPFLSLNIGYKTQHATVYGSDRLKQFFITKDKYTFNRLSLGVGVSF